MEINFNGVSSADHSLIVTQVKRGVLPPKAAQMLTAPGRPGAYFFRSETGVTTFTVSFDLIGEATIADFENRKRLIAEWLDVDEPAPLVFDYELDKTYYAIPDGNYDLERAGTYGSFDVTFICPDPYAYGITKTGTVAQVYPAFSRGGGIRYRNDGTQVTADYPYYQPGKFGDAILIEEGTSNLLTTASVPAAEEVSVTQGGNYTLSIYGTNPSAKIEHKRVENIANTTLAKEGTDFSQTIDTTWNTGTLSGTVAASDGTNQYGILQLAKSGTDLSKTWTSDTDFSGGSFSGTAVYGTGTNAYIALNNQPNWGTRDGMTSLSTWNGSGTAGATVDPGGFIRVTSSASVNVGIDRQPAVTFTNGFTLDFRARTSDGNSSFYISDGSVRFSDAIPSTNGNWSWFRIRITNSTTGYLYQDGTLIKTLTSSSYSTRRILLGYRSSGTAGATYDFDAVYFTIGADYGPPPANHTYTGTYISPGLDLSSVALEGTSNWTGTTSNSSLYSLEVGTNTIEFQAGTYSGGSVTWDTTWSSEFPYTKGADLTNKWVRWRTTQSIKDSGDAPWLRDITISLTSGYVASGSYESPVVDISQVGKAASTLQNWTMFSTQPPGTTVTLSTRYSLDGGSTWSAYADTTNGGTIPGISQSTDLSNARFQYKFTLSTTDVGATPQIDKTTYTFTTGYKTSQTFTLPGYSVGSIGTSAGSLASWTETKPSGTNIVVESSLDNTNWSVVTNGGTLFANGTDLTGKTLYLRYTLSTTDTSQTPTMGASLTWKIAQQDPAKIIPATSTLSFTPTNVARWQLEAKPYATGWQPYGTARNAETLTYKASILNAAQGTAELWAYEEGENAVRRYLLDIDGSSRFSLYRDTDGKYHVVFNGTDAMSTNAPAVGWHHVAIRWNGMDVALFIDGAQAASATLADAVAFTGATKLYVGSRNDGTLQWNGLLDDLMISNIARSDTEILAHATNGQPMTPDENKTLKLTFDDSLAPSMDTSDIANNGTAPTYPVITATMGQASTYLKISSGADFVYISRNFVAGDVVVIDCAKAIATVNGVRVPVSLDSNFFALSKGAINITTDPAGVADVTISYAERWK
ncbi:phage tail family protein [Thermoactinomyces daqus]|uniref:Phage tail family protein n=1 Tax=Thermoactinomyces daqus TaxID=1329516 RepID=A0A7W1X8M4_9BACL|nr:distal tail protein Dit [Thermoactinomyces daqus]MBA4542004.1 phage tail family protein [Thermoactinomyces daqus]